MPPIEILRLVLLVTHFIGLAAIIGSFILQLRVKTGFDFRPMLAGAIVQLVSGYGLVAARRIGDLGVDNVKIAVKLGVALVVLVAVIVALVRRRRAVAAGASDLVARPWFHLAGAGAIANVVVAVVWI